MVNKGLSPDRLGEMNSRHKQSLENIKQLQNMEKELYASLDTSVSGRSISKAEQTKIINKINELSTMRMNLYMNMKDMYLFLQTNVSDTRNNLVNDFHQSFYFLITLRLILDLNQKINYYLK